MSETEKLSELISEVVRAARVEKAARDLLTMARKDHDEAANVLHKAQQAVSVYSQDLIDKAMALSLLAVPVGSSNKDG